MFKSPKTPFFAGSIRSSVSDVEKELLNALSELFEPLGRMDLRLPMLHNKIGSCHSIFQKVSIPMSTIG